MKNVLLVSVMISTVLLGSGCIVVVSEDENGPPQPEVVCGSNGPTIQEIDAVGKLAFDSERQSAYKRIATRSGLSDAAQAHLVQAVFDHLSSESAKEDVLLRLIENPCFGPAGRQAVLAQLDRLSFESAKSRILKAISDRGGPGA